MVVRMHSPLVALAQVGCIAGCVTLGRAGGGRFTVVDGRVVAFGVAQLQPGLLARQETCRALAHVSRAAATTP